MGFWWFDRQIKKTAAKYVPHRASQVIHGLLQRVKQHIRGNCCCLCICCQYCAGVECGWKTDRPPACGEEAAVSQSNSESLEEKKRNKSKPTVWPSRRRTCTHPLHAELKDWRLSLPSSVVMSRLLPSDKMRSHGWCQFYWVPFVSPVHYWQKAGVMKHAVTADIAQISRWQRQSDRAHGGVNEEGCGVKRCGAPWAVWIELKAEGLQLALQVFTRSSCVASEKATLRLPDKLANETMSVFFLVCEYPLKSNSPPSFFQLHRQPLMNDTPPPFFLRLPPPPHPPQS